MADTPDLSRIVNMIMENPSLVAQISAMANGASENEQKEDKEVTSEASAPATPTAGGASKSTNRARLLGAMKPYLSKERGQAIDTMISIAEILELSRRRG
jgi:hypothetical protein